MAKEPESPKKSQILKKHGATGLSTAWKRLKGWFKHAAKTVVQNPALAASFASTVIAASAGLVAIDASRTADRAVKAVLSAPSVIAAENIKNLRNDLEETQSTLEELSEESKNLASAVESGDAKEAEIRAAQVASLVEKVSDISSRLEQRSSEMERVSPSEVSKSDLQSISDQLIKVSNTLSEVASRLEQVAGRTAEIDEVKNRLDTAEKSLGESQADLQELGERMRAVERKATVAQDTADKALDGVPVVRYDNSTSVDEGSSVIKPLGTFTTNQAGDYLVRFGTTSIGGGGTYEYLRDGRTFGVIENLPNNPVDKIIMQNLPADTTYGISVRFTCPGSPPSSIPTSTTPLQCQFDSSFVSHERSVK